MFGGQDRTGGGRGAEEPDMDFCAAQKVCARTRSTELSCSSLWAPAYAYLNAFLLDKTFLVYSSSNKLASLFPAKRCIAFPPSSASKELFFA